MLIVTPHCSQFTQRGTNSKGLCERQTPQLWVGPPLPVQGTSWADTNLDAFALSSVRVYTFSRRGDQKGRPATTLDAAYGEQGYYKGHPYGKKWIDPDHLCRAIAYKAEIEGGQDHNPVPLLSNASVITWMLRAHPLVKGEHGACGYAVGGVAGILCEVSPCPVCSDHIASSSESVPGQSLPGISLCKALFPC